MTNKDELAKLQRELHTQSIEAHMPQDDLAEVRELARQKVTGFSACLEERAVAINKVNPDLSPIQCWRNERGGGVRLDRAVLSYWTEFDTVPQPASYPRPWDFMRKGHYLHVMFFRDHKGINDQELWLKLPLEPIESAWVMTVHYSRDGGFEQPSQVESRTRHTSSNDRVLADFCLDRLIRIAYQPSGMR